jgi:hypothetical protein
MSTFSGRRSTGAAKRFGKGLLDGLAYVGTALADGPKLQRIEEIEGQIEALTWERNKLISELIEPGNLKVDEDFDANRPPVTHAPRVRAGEGRLTECEGQFSTSSDWHVHPGCPYKGSRHGAHEFTLND